MKCPICVSKKTHYFAEKNTYKFYRCIICKTLFLSVLPSRKKLDSYYGKQFSYTDGIQNETIIRKRSRYIIKIIKRLAPQAKSLCDVGSGFGFFLNEAHSSGYKITGIEPSEKLAAYTEKHYSIKTFVGALKEYINTVPKRFDIVTCIHVIEHVINPKEFIFHLMKLVKPGGILYLETPNSDSHLLYVEREEYTFLIPPDHLWIFSKDSIKNILPNNAEIIHINTYSYSEHVMGILKKILKRTHHSTEPRKESFPINKIASKKNIKQFISYLIFDRMIAPLFIGILNSYHKGSILELCIKKKDLKCGL